MPTYTIVIWNIQDFGGRAGLNQRFGPNGLYRASFIAQYLKSLNADILGVIEVQPQATIAALSQLQSSLNFTEKRADRDWAYDSIKSALEKDVALTSNAATTWENGGPRREGYAFFWRTNRGFTVVPAARWISEGVKDPPGKPLPSSHFLDLVTFGRNFENVDKKGWLITAGFTTASTFPVKDNKPVSSWSALDFLTVSRGGSGIPTYFRTRRPAFIVVKTKTGKDEATLLPVVFFHCPSYHLFASFSVGISSYAQQHYVTYPLDDGKPDVTKLTVIDNVISAGDYNYSASESWPGLYFTYTNSYKKTPDGGVNATALLVPSSASPEKSRTTIQLSDQKNGRFDGDPITSTDADAYRRLSIDNLFYRGLTKGTGSGTENLVATVMSSTNAMSTRIKIFKKILDAALKNTKQYPKKDKGGPYFARERKKSGGGTYEQKVYAIPNIVDWDNFYNGVSQGYFTTARSAAEFVRYFISDHLPLIFKFTVT